MPLLNRDAVRLYGDSVLRTPATDVTEFGDALRRLVNRLLRIQSRLHAIGIAAVQIGEPWNVFAINGAEIKRGGKPEVFVNPRILSADGEETDEEGCLSFPDVFVRLPRPRHIVLQAQDLEGRLIAREATGLLARAFSHETDHLQGRMIIDRMNADDRRRVLARLRRHNAKHAH